MQIFCCKDCLKRRERLTMTNGIIGPNSLLPCNSIIYLLLGLGLMWVEHTSIPGLSGLAHVTCFDRQKMSSHDVHRGLKGT